MNDISKKGLIQKIGELTEEVRKISAYNLKGRQEDAATIETQRLEIERLRRQLLKLSDEARHYQLECQKHQATIKKMLMGVGDELRELEGDDSDDARESNPAQP